MAFDLGLLFSGAVVLGAGSISFEMLRYLTERLPFMVCPRWVRTAIQPIASADITRYLIAAIDVAPGVYEVGGADVTSYGDMIAAYALARGLRRRRKRSAAEWRGHGAPGL